MAAIADLEKEIKLIKQRNQRVETEKSWEVSWVRKIMIGILTYIVISLFFLVAELPKPFLNSIVPTLAFLLSTLSLNYMKVIWLKFFKKS